MVFSRFVRKQVVGVHVFCRIHKYLSVPPPTRKVLFSTLHSYTNHSTPRVAMTGKTLDDATSGSLGPSATRPMDATRFAFGCQHEGGPILDLAIRQVLGEARDRIHLIEDIPASLAKLSPGMRIGAKMLNEKRIYMEIELARAAFGSQLHRILLAKPMGIEAWRALESLKEEGHVAEIGVSNYSHDKLAELLAECVIIPDVVQNEYHPFIRTDVPKLCAQHNIRFEAHSVLTGKEFLKKSAAEKKCTVEELAIAFCTSQGLDVVFFTDDIVHLRRTLDVPTKVILTPAEVSDISLLSFVHPIRLGVPQGSVEENVDMLYRQLAKDVDAFRGGECFSNLCMSITKTHRDNKGNGSVSRQLATVLFPDNTTCAAYSHFDALMKQMRIATMNIKAEEDARAKNPKVSANPRQQVAFPEALPVLIPEADLFSDFFSEIRGGARDYPRKMVAGCLFPDGRMDLCKQVIQPRFEELCDVVRTSPQIKHFLIGNNVAFDMESDEEISRHVRALTTLLTSNPPIETWYLAGNYIRKDLCEPIADAFLEAKTAKALWLKMNPVKTGVEYFGRVVALHRNLELIDLFNTGLLDEGVRAFLNGLRTGLEINADLPIALKHIYFSINDISDGDAVAEVVKLLPQLESFFIGVNMLKDSGAERVIEALKGCPNLQRLELGSNDLSDAILPHLIDLAKSCPNLRSLVLGSYKSTRFFGCKDNRFTSIPLLAELASHLDFINLGYALASRMDLQELKNAIPDTTIAYLAHRRIAKTTTFSDDDRAKARALSHPYPFVDHIDSIYRNAM
eukprot:GEMP01004870.1.p1 GENE.GEMP01004870.1~~GEMP01004870.1.p1  ORF type:complete len:793 (-),score=196.00 GEMP01004870.1:1637-4015(-)